MNSFETASAFFHACEGLKGWSGCKQYVADGATFSAQSEPIAGITTVEDYCEWMAGLGSGPLAGCNYDLHASAWDASNNTALFFATFSGRHSGEGGPVPATNKSTSTHYVYAVEMNKAGKVNRMRKIWNASWALRELGWG